MKALILAGGRGKRLGNITNSLNKCMLSLGGKPVLEYNIDRAAEIQEIDDIIIVVGHKATDIINRYGIEYGGKRIRYVIQWEQKGLVHAIECTKRHVGKSDFFLLLGDEFLLNSRHKGMVSQFLKENLFGVCGLIFQKNTNKIGKTYAVIQDNNFRIRRLIEKPREIYNNWQGTGHCVFKNEILSYIKKTPINPERGEKELPDLIQCAIDDGRSVKSYDLCDEYININSEEDLHEAQQLIKKIQYPVIKTRF